MFALRVVGAAAAVAKANVKRLRVPLKVNLCVTYACQYRCKTCNIWQRKPHDELTTDELLAFVELNRGIRWLDVTGGEIFLRKDIGEVLDAVVSTWRRLAVLHFPTNGFLTDPIVAAAERLAAASSIHTVITVSLDGDEQQNDEVRGIRGGFQRQMATFKILRKIRGIHVVLGMTLSRFNAGTFERTFAACQRQVPDLRAAEFHLNLAQQSDHYYGNSDDVVAAPFHAIADDLAAYERRLGMQWSPAALIERAFLGRMREFQANGKTPMACHALRSNCFIDPSGTVFPCISYSSPIGRLRETGMNLQPIWESHAARRMQTDIWSGSCPQCWTACEAYPSILGNMLRPHIFDAR
jgi:MoaA/NifB/PqqE/SkfB family radical SAM enzyme